MSSLSSFHFFFTDPAPTEIYTLSLHDALPICHCFQDVRDAHVEQCAACQKGVVGNVLFNAAQGVVVEENIDRKSTRLNSSHVKISYAVFCLKKKTILQTPKKYVH